MPENFNILVSGTGSGLGAAIYSALGGVPLDREAVFDQPAINQAQPFDAIVHCAFNAAKQVTTGTAYRYLEDNFLLTQRLLDIPHRKFIYVSTLDVYPRIGRAISENEDIDLSSLAGPYAFTKLFSDLLVQQAPNHLILRPATLMGPVMRPSTTYRILTERRCRVFLSPEARFNYILHRDMVDLVRLAITDDLRGVVNVASSGNVRLQDIVTQLGLSVQCGDYLYDIGPVENRRAAELLPAFARPSWQTLNAFIDELGSAFVGTGRLAGGMDG